MTPLARLQGLNGRVVLVVFVGLLTGWALALLKQSQYYVPDHVPVPDSSDLDMRRRQLLEYTPQSLLEQFYREMGATTRRIDPTGVDPIRADELAIVLHPRAQAPERLVDRLEEHVKQGGRLVVFTDTELDLLERFGLQTQPVNDPVTFDPVPRVGATVEDAHVQNALAPRLRSVTGAKRPLVPLLQLKDTVIAGTAGYGKGTVTVITARMADYAWIEREDNAIFLANLLLEKPQIIGLVPQLQNPPQLAVPRQVAGRARVASVAILDYDAEVLRRIYALEAEQNHRMEEARRRWQYDSLWSLIKANPVSAALIQLVLGLMMFAMGRARRLGEALPDRMGRVEMPGTLEARANLFERSGAYRLAISRAVRHTNRWLAARLGLIGEPTAEELRAALETVSTKATVRYQSIVRTVAEISDGHTAADDRSLTAVWNLIDALRRELPQQ